MVFEFVRRQLPLNFYSGAGSPHRIADKPLKIKKIDNHLHSILDVDFGQDRSQMKNANLIENIARINKLAMAILELIRRLKNRQERGARVISFNEIRCGVQNDPMQAIEYIETFLLHSNSSPD